ncbi:MAG: ATP-binding cassette domain-containing protein [Eubacteriales bacterium]|nr:ATP-binding cassette domain-containing protein [Eubacteriales bacterium]
MNREVLLELKDLHTFFKVKSGILKAVNGIDLTIYKGESIGLVGESGCGKSTLGKTIMRLYKPQKGQVLYKGKDIWDFNKKELLQYRKDIQMIFQDPYASFDPLTIIGDTIAEGMDIHRMHQGKERSNKILELLKLIGLGREHMNRFPHEFSGGQRQRVGIARALALEPQLIVCDEPISALDVSIQAQIVNLLNKLQKEVGVSYLFITHDLSMVKQISDRIAVMYLGSLVEISPSEEIYEKNYHPYTKALLSAIPIPDPIIEKKRKRIILNGDIPSPVNLKEECAFVSRCPYATEECRCKRPELKEISPDHFVSCFNADKIEALENQSF